MVVHPYNPSTLEVKVEGNNFQTSLSYIILNKIKNKSFLVWDGVSDAQKS